MNVEIVARRSMTDKPCGKSRLTRQLLQSRASRGNLRDVARERAIYQDRRGRAVGQRTIKIRIKDKAAARSEALEIARRLDAGERDPRWAQEVLTFHDIDSLRSVLTDERLELLRLIRQKHPASLTELAALSGRDLKQVNEDVQQLALLGFIEVEKSPPGEGRDRKPRTPATIPFWWKFP